MYIDIEHIVWILVVISACICLYLFLPRRSEKIDLEKLLNSIGYSEDKLCSELINLFKYYWEAFNKRDIVLMKELVDEMFTRKYINLLYKEADLGHTVFKEDFLLNSYKLIDITRAGKELYVALDIDFSIYDYILDENNNVIYGSKNKRKRYKRRMIFNRRISGQLIKICPFCGADIDDDSNYCENCHQAVKVFYGDFKIFNEQSGSKLRRWYKKWR